jgi:hypothetical protein
MKLAVVLALAACAHHAPAPVAPASSMRSGGLVDELRAASHGQPVLLATNSTGVAAYTADGTLLRQLTTDGTVGLELDERREILLLEDKDATTILALDLREASPKPIALAENVTAEISSDDGRPDMRGELRIRWSEEPAITFASSCGEDPDYADDCPAEARRQHDAELADVVAKIKLVGAAWIAANAARPLRAPRPVRQFVKGRAKLSSSLEVVAGRFCEHDCMGTCLLHDPGRDLWLPPKRPAEWTKDHDLDDSGNGLCALDLDDSGRFWFSNGEVCHAGADCLRIDDVSQVVGWIDPGVQVAEPIVDQHRN